jgi:hypothetical protein
LGQKRRVVQYYEKGERDGKSYDIPKYIRLACYALTKGMKDYEGPEEVTGGKGKRKSKSGEGKHKAKDKTKSKKRGKPDKADGLSESRLKARGEHERKHGKSAKLDVLAMATKAKDEPQRKRAKR